MEIKRSVHLSEAIKNRKQIGGQEIISVPLSSSLPTPSDQKKRLFLKFLGVAGLGVVGSLLLPKKADAYVFGSTPSSSVVGIKDTQNTPINPATEESLALVATEATLANIKTATDKLTFDVDGNLLTAGGGSASVVGLKNAADTRINPATNESVALLATDENLLLLRRITKQMESLATIDSSQRQKITLDAISGSLTLGTITTVTGVTTVSTVTTVATVTSATNLIALGGVDGRYLYIDTARNAYANGIRNNL